VAQESCVEAFPFFAAAVIEHHREHVDPVLRSLREVRKARRRSASVNIRMGRCAEHRLSRGAQAVTMNALRDEGVI